MSKVKTYIIPRKIYYQRSSEDKGLTNCPFEGGAQVGVIGHRDLFHTYPDAKVGGMACCDCKFNRGVEYDYIKCIRKGA